MKPIFSVITLSLFTSSLSLADETPISCYRMQNGAFADRVKISNAVHQGAKMKAKVADRDIEMEFLVSDSAPGFPNNFSVSIFDMTGAQPSDKLFADKKVTLAVANVADTDNLSLSLAVTVAQKEYTGVICRKEK